MYKLLCAVTAFLLFCVPISHATVRIDEDGVSKGYVKNLDFQNGPTITRDAITGIINFAGAFDSDYLRLDGTNSPSTNIDWDNKAILNVKLGSLTDNGFVKTSGADGTLSVDTNRYLLRDLANGTFKEFFNALVTSNGSIVTLTVTNAGGGNLTSQFSSGDSTFTGGSTIVLTAGSDVSPTENFIYILESASTTLVKSTSSFPTVEHIKVGYFLVPSAGFTQTNGVYVNQNWNDEQVGTDNMGDLAHIGEKLRRLTATYFSGVDGNGIDNYLTVGAGTVDLKSTAGIIYQKHAQTVPAFDTSSGDVVLVRNWNGDAFHDITNLYDIVNDSTGATIGNNKHFNLVVWGVGNKTGEYQPMMINLPGGFYNTQADAENDVSGHDDFSMPREFNRESSTGFLISRITIQMKTGGGTWVVESTTDLRGLTPSNAASGIGSIVKSFADNVFSIFDESDDTKIAVFDVGANISTGTTRTFTFPDADTLIGTPEGTVVLSTGELITKFLRADGDGTSSWQVPAGGGAGTYYKHFKVQSAKLTGSDITNSAGIDAGDRGWRLLFDDTTEESALWQFVCDPNYSAGTLTLEILFSMTSVQTGTLNVKWDVKVMSATAGDAEDWNTDGYAAERTVTHALANNQPAGYPRLATITFTQAQVDAMAIDDIVRIHISRDGSVGSDASGDAEILGLEWHE